MRYASFRSISHGKVPMHNILDTIKNHQFLFEELVSLSKNTALS